MHTNQGATIETIPMSTGTVTEGTILCQGAALGKSAWYSLHLPVPGTLRIDAAARGNAGDDFDYDAIPLDPVLLLAGADAAGHWVGIAGGSSAFCANATGAGGTESITQHLAAGDYRVGVAGVRLTDFGSEQDNASDGLYQVNGAFTPDPTPTPTPPASVSPTPTATPKPPALDRDGDGVPDAVDRCPTVKATTDSDHDGCTDALKALAAEVKYEWGKWYRNGAFHGGAIKVVRIKHLAAGSSVKATCRGCKAFRGGKARAFKAYSTTARKSGT